MNYIAYPQSAYQRLVNDDKYLLDCINYLNANHEMYLSGEFAFEEGVIQVSEQVLCYFRACEYLGEDDSMEQGKIGFVIHANVRGETATFFIAISELEVKGERYLDWFLEPLNDWATAFSKKFPDRFESVLCKILIPLDQIQRKALESQRKIIRIRNDVEQKVTSNPNVKRVESKVISLSGGIKYQYVFEREETRSYTRHTGTWDVRGHYRHYKSGKVVFIKPFKKGVGKANDKKYAISL